MVKLTHGAAVAQRVCTVHLASSTAPAVYGLCFDLSDNALALTAFVMYFSPLV